MKKLLTIAAILLFTASSLFAQKAKEQVYDENADPVKDIKKAVELAQKENKHVMLVIGGNWCSWCMKLNKLIKSDEEIKSALYDNYQVVKVNYSKGHIPTELLEKLQFPQRLGFPVIVILDQDGKRIHTQSSGYLEEDKGYSKKKLTGFFKDWTVAKLDPASYKK
jgi:thioredoxin-related protein